MSGKNTGKISGFSRFIAGKGFYIVLLLCVAAVGAAAWAILFSSPESSIQMPDDLTVYTDQNTGSHADSLPALNLPHVEIDTGDEVLADSIPTQPSTTGLPPSEPPVADTSAAIDEAAPVMAEFSVAQAPDHYVWPLSGNIELPYSVAALVYNRTMADWRTHPGIDIAANLGVKVMAVASGTVKDIYEDDMYGTTVVIDHGSGIESAYSNLAATPAVGIGGSVALGDVIGSVGDTALCEIADVTHLHFEMRANGEAADPLEYLPDR